MNDAGMFVTVLYGVLDRTTREFVYVRAGHEMPILVDACREVMTLSRGHGHPLAFIPDPDLDEQRVIIPPSCLLLLYTDGVTDMVDVEGTFFGLERLRQVVRAGGSMPAQAVCDRLLQTVMEYRGAAPQADDVTLVAVYTQ